MSSFSDTADARRGLPPSAPIGPGDCERLEAVRRYEILDTPPDGASDRITAPAARIFDVPISIVSIVDTDRIWFKSRHGIDATEVGRDPASARRRSFSTSLGELELRLAARREELVQQMNGRIWFESRQGQGSTFVFELPFSE